MTTPAQNIVGSILQLQAQRLTTIDQRTKDMSEQIDKLENHVRQLSKLQVAMNTTINRKEH